MPRLRTIAAVLGAGFALQGVAWLVDPLRAATGLYMPLLDGLGRSTQIGDFASFFLVAGATMLAGARRGHERLLWVPAGLFGCAAIGRTLAWAIHGAGFAWFPIAVETAATVLLATVARDDAPGPP